jgi:hypothetical protein
VGTLLCVGLYPYDVVHVLAVAREAHRRLGLEPLFLDIANLAPDEVRAQVRELVAANGYQSVTASLVGSGNRPARNRLDRRRQQRSGTLQLMDRVLDDVRPAAILAGVNPPWGSFVDHAAARGVPTVYLQLFHWGDRAFYRGLFRDDRRKEDVGLSPPRRVQRGLGRRIDAHYGFAPRVAWDVRRATLAVQGPAMRQRIIAGRVPSDHVVATGNPELDELYSLRASTEEAGRQLRRQLGLPTATRIITQMRSHEARLVSLSPRVLQDSQAQVIRALRSSDPDAQVIVKLHPKEDETEKAFVRSIDPSVLVVGDEVATNDLLAASDVVVGALSTTLLHSVLLDRPTIRVWLWPGLEYFRKSTDWSGVEHVDSPAALTEAVRHHLEDAEHRDTWRRRREAFIAEEFVYDGRCTDRVVDELERLMRKSSPIGAGDGARAGSQTSAASKGLR